MGWRETCIEEVNNMIPPGTMCDYDRCMKIQKRIDDACHNRNWAPGSPYVLDNPDGSVCYCCCSCFGYDTPIAVADGAFKMIQDFVAGDMVWSAVMNNGVIDHWASYSVATSTGLPASEGSEPYMLLIRYGVDESSTEDVLVTEDHLFLQPTGKLIPANALKVGDALVRPDNSIVTIRFVQAGTRKIGVHHIATGPFVNNDLSGHLLNANNIVCADLAVQVSYVTGQIGSGLMADDLDSRLRAGSAEYQLQYHNAEVEEFVSDPQGWPAGFTPISFNTLINVPATAYSFLTDRQAADILEGGAPRRDFTSSYAMEMAEHAISTFETFYPGPIYLLDWSNFMPNAYTWSSFGKQYVVVTGGLVRLFAVRQEGLSLILAHLVAIAVHSDDEYPVGNCAGAADYRAVSNVLGRIWWDNLYLDMARASIEQIADLFNLIPPADRGGDPNDKCQNPSTDCRLSAFRAALSLGNLPRCADPNLPDFVIQQAIPSPTQLVLIFNLPVDIPTAQMAANYHLQPAAVVTAAMVDPVNHARVTLNVALVPGTYTLTVANVLNMDGEPLAPQGSHISFTL